MRQLRARVRTRFDRPDRVRAALRAATERLAGPRRCAAVRVWREIARVDAAPRPSRFNAPSVARERRRETVCLPCRALAVSRLAWRRTLAEEPRDGGNLTPARLALDRPMAMACRGERAPCFPSRT